MPEDRGKGGGVKLAKSVEEAGKLAGTDAWNATGYTTDRT